MSRLSFLNKVEIKETLKVSTRVNESKKPVEGADFRVYANGAVFPSEEITRLLNLEYQKKEVTKGKNEAGEEVTILVHSDNPGCGLDIFRSSDYQAITGLVEPVIFLAAVPRTEGKLDLFKSCEYTADGTPKTSVLLQGSTTFGKNELHQMLEETYGVKLDKDNMPFVDLKVVGNGEGFNMPWMNTTGSSVYRIPKRYTRGAEAGQLSTVRREDIQVWALVPMEWVSDLGFEIELSGKVSEAPVVGAPGN